MDLNALRSKVRSARQELDLSQAVVAKRSGASRVTIARFESGDDQDLRLGTLMRVCDALGLEVAILPQGDADPDGRQLEHERQHRRRLIRRLQHAALAARLLLMPARMANAKVVDARAVVEGWRRERACRATHALQWRRMLSGSRERVARALLRQNETTDAFFEQSPWLFALDPV
jgi:transcriptional regulator with XRE-family HTH domain